MSRIDRKSEEIDATRGLLDPSHDDDPRLLAAVKEYLGALESGKRPNRKEFLARHQEIADELSVCLNGLNFVQAAAAQVPGSGASEAQKPPEEMDEHLSAKPLGDFKLVREIGRGGMGVVYEAIQLSLGRRVAVKVLSLAAALDSRHLQRFKNEAQAAAQLHHTNIVPVYQVGCERSVHFYAMQLIDGQTLADVIRDLRRIAGRSPLRREASANGNSNGNGNGHANGGVKRLESLDELPMSANPPPISAQVTNLSVQLSDKRQSFFRSVARLGLQAAEALEYAHKLGVVHRDIKPANLMLDVRNNLWITDFGLAQFYAVDSGLTQTGDLVGTYRYMSPEQASGRAVVLDQRTDIYSLGVTLYELLTLERAVPGETRDQLLHQISNVDPKPPKSIDKTIPQELDTILMKSIAKEPADRYASAGAMAEDLRRFLQDEPILARPPTSWDKAVKWTRRHKGLALSVILMLLLVAIGFFISTIFVARAQSRTKAAFMLEQQSFRQAREVVDFFTTKVNELDGPLPQDVVQNIRKEMLEKSLEYYQGFVDQRKDDATLEADLTAARTHVTSLLNELLASEEWARVSQSPRLLALPPVQSDLQLNADQVKEAAALSKGVSTDPGDLGRQLWGMTTEQREAKLSALVSETQAKVAAILSSEQLDRLNQISRQNRGSKAFNDSDVSAALELTRMQKELIRTIQNERPADPGTTRPSGRGPDFRQMDQEKVGKIVALLTPAQQDVWDNLIGEPYTGPWPNPRFGGGGRFGGRGPRPPG